MSNIETKSTPQKANPIEHMATHIEKLLNQDDEYLLDESENLISEQNKDNNSEDNYEDNNADNYKDIESDDFLPDSCQNDYYDDYCGNETLQDARILVNQDVFKKKISWNCSVCTFYNDGYRTICEVCHSKNPHPPLDWKCDCCAFMNNGMKVSCIKCKYLRKW